jgi:hypothetical protein
MRLKKLSQIRARAKQFKDLRDGLMLQLYPTESARTYLSLTDPQGNTDPTNTAKFILTNFLGSFQRYTGNQQTAYDRGSVSASATSSANVLERQVGRAISQVLGRTPGRGAENFINALNDAFPVAADGQVTFTQSRSIVQLYSPSSSTGVVGQLSARQATLYRQASIVAGDALKVLAGLKSFVPEADTERVESLRAVIGSEIKTLVDEFGRVDEPRSERVQSYLDAIVNHLAEFGEQAYLNNPVLVATTDDEAQTSGFELLNNYVLTILRTAWNEYRNTEKPDSPGSYSLSERLERANVLLPVLAQGNTDFEDAMESVGFSESERRSRAARFSTLAVSFVTQPENDTLGGALETTINPIGGRLPDITVNDLTNWLDRFSNIEGPSILSNGEYGLVFVTDQADRLFWTIAPVVGYLATTLSLNRSNLGRILSNERVRWSLDNLLSQLQTLADLAV